MKTKLIAACVSLLLLGMPGCALAQQLAAVPTHPVAVRVFVHDPDGKPVEGAEVALSLTYYRVRSVEGKTVRELTDKEGFATVSGMAESEYRVGAGKSGYYRTVAPTRDLDSEYGLKQYANGTHEMDIELRPIRNQVAGINRGFDGLLIPELNKPFGFDLEVGDWVAPYGKGKAADLIFRLDGYFNSPDDYIFKFNASYGRPGDGLQPVKVEPNAEIGSAFRLPYEAPLTGYEAAHVWERAHVGGQRVISEERKGGTFFLFRVRTVLDSSGNVVRALYGYMDGNLDFRGTPEKGYKLSFTYWLNPEWTRSLEADPKKTVTSVKP